MTNILDAVSQLVSEGRVVQESALGSLSTSRESFIVWNGAPLNTDVDTLSEFREAVRRRGAKFYTCAHILSYPDFCISILCARDYSMSHEKTPLIPYRAYVAAWRAVDTVSVTAPRRVQEWLSQHVAGRTAAGYANEAGTENSIDRLRESDGSDNRPYDEDSDALALSLESGVVRRVDIHNESSMLSTGSVFPTARAALLTLSVQHQSRHLRDV